MTDANELLMRGGVPSARFPTIGASVEGIIVREPYTVHRREYMTRKLMFWDDGSPQEQVVVLLASNERQPNVPHDNGVRALYLRYGNRMRAVQDAMYAAGVFTLEVGGWLKQTYTGDAAPTEDTGGKPAKLWVAQYVPPQAMTGDAAPPGLSSAVPTLVPVPAPAAVPLATASPAPMPASVQAPQGFTMPAPPAPAAGVPVTAPAVVPAAANPPSTWAPPAPAAGTVLPPAPPALANLSVEHLQTLGFGPPVSA
jgi:hypothetical protein